MINNEPSLEEIEDFNGRGNEEKRKTVNFVIMACLFVGVIYTIAKVTNSSVSDELIVHDRVLSIIK